MQADAYDPLPVGGVDTFCCDFTADSGSAAIASTTWTASFDAGSTDAFDPDPQSRILGSWAADEIDVRSTIDGTISTISGQFSVAMIGGFPQSAIGGTLCMGAIRPGPRILEAWIRIDGSGIVPCKGADGGKQ